jgi:ABC-type multidrug transport system ATPase subunit
MNRCGYIEQNELFIGSMTVREHLTFQVKFFFSFQLNNILFCKK